MHVHPVFCDDSCRAPGVDWLCVGFKTRRFPTADFFGFLLKESRAGCIFLTLIIIYQITNTTTMKKVTGIGGIFFKCKDPKALREWYNTHLGFDAGDYGASFEWREDADPEKKGVTQWSPFSDTTKYFAPSEKEFMINYRVENLVELVEALKKEGVTVVDEIADSEYGKFVHIIDLEGNKVELWEP